MEWIFKREGKCYKGRKSLSSISSCSFNDNKSNTLVTGVFFVSLNL